MLTFTNASDFFFLFNRGGGHLSLPLKYLIKVEAKTLQEDRMKEKAGMMTKTLEEDVMKEKAGMQEDGSEVLSRIYHFCFAEKFTENTFIKDNSSAWIST